MKRLTGRLIDVYPSIWRVVGLVLISLLFVVGGFFMTSYPRAGIDRYMGYIGMGFFSLGVIAGIVWLIFIAMRKPLARIYDDRLEYLIPRRMKYEIIPFLHVEMFVISKVGGVKYIRAECLTGDVKNTGLSNTLIPVDKVCDILNDRLEVFWLNAIVATENDASQALLENFIGEESIKCKYGVK